VDPLILFWIVALLSVASGMTVILHRNPVYSALALVVALFQIAVIFVALDAHLIALLQIIVYAGAIVVLFLFVIMLLSLEPDVPHRGRYAMRVAALCLTMMMGIELGTVTLLSGPPAQSSLPSGYGSTQMVAELTSVLLLVAVVGAVVMARRRA
jgi:NADH-quinone oxidoreductase subunit J